MITGNSNQRKLSTESREAIKKILSERENATAKNLVNEGYLNSKPDKPQAIKFSRRTLFEIAKYCDSAGISINEGIERLVRKALETEENPTAVEKIRQVLPLSKKIMEILSEEKGVSSFVSH